MGKRIIKGVYASIPVALVGVGVAWSLAMPSASVEERPVTGGLPSACPTEDSDNCYWDGGENGLGATFVTLNGHTVYLTEKGR